MNVEKFTQKSIELQEKITALNKQNEEKLIEWEELEKKLTEEY